MHHLGDLARGVGKFTVGAEGNVSERSGESFWIKASGASLSTLSEENIVECDIDGEPINSLLNKPSMEVSFHSWLYKRFSEIRFIAHTHPTNTLKILCSDYAVEFSKNRLFPDHVVYNNIRSCLVEYAMPGLELCAAIYYGVERFWQEEGYMPNLILLQNHGIICLGKTFKDCIFATEICEKAAKIFLGTKQLGRTRFLAKEQCIQIKDDKNEKYRQSENNLR